MIIRRALFKDISDITQMWKELMDFHGLNEDFFMVSPDAYKHYGDFIEECIHNQDWIVLIAIQEELPVGFLTAAIREYPSFYGGIKYGFIDDVAVIGIHRSKGIGNKLYQSAERWFMEKGIKRIELRAAVTNQLAKAVWVSKGYRDFMITMVKEL